MKVKNNLPIIVIFNEDGEKVVDLLNELSDEEIVDVFIELINIMLDFDEEGLEN